MDTLKEDLSDNETQIYYSAGKRLVRVDISVRFSDQNKLFPLSQLWRHKFRDNVSRYEQDCIRRDVDVHFHDTCTIKVRKD